MPPRLACRRENPPCEGTARGDTRRMQIITNHRLGYNTTPFFAEANEKWRTFELSQISHFSVKRDLGTRLMFITAKRSTR